MTDAEAAEMQNLTARLELANREMARLKIVLGAIERQNYSGRIESLEATGDIIASELGEFHPAAECEALQAWYQLRTKPIDPDATPTGV